MPLLLLLLLLLLPGPLLVSAAGCGDDDRPPAAPGGGGGGGTGGGSGGGGDDDDDDMDGETADAGPSTDSICLAIDDPGVGFFTANVFGTGTVLDVEPDFLGVRYLCRGGGTDAQLEVVLGPSRDCSSDVRGALSFRFLADDIGGLISTGSSLELAPTPGIVDPVELSLFVDPTGGGVGREFGTCSAETTGFIDFEDANTLRGERFRVINFTASLGSCDNPLDSPIQVDANFDFLVPATFEDVCR